MRNFMDYIKYLFKTFHIISPSLWSKHFQKDSPFAYSLINKDTMNFFRSERMALCQILLHKESAFDCLVSLGYMGVVQFNDADNVENVPNGLFLSEIRRANELQRVAHHISEAMNECDVPSVYYPNVDLEEIPTANDLKMMEEDILRVEAELSDVERQYDELKHEKNKLLERYHVIMRSQDFLHGERNTESLMAWSDSIIMSLIRDDMREINTNVGKTVHLRYITGTIPTDRIYPFEQMLWRVCHSNFYLKHADIPDLLEDALRSSTKVRKSVFMLFFLGDNIRAKIIKICQGFRTMLFECPETTQARFAELTKLKSNIDDMNVVIDRTDQHRRRIFLLTSPDIYIWKVKLKKILMVYTLLNKLGTIDNLHNYFHAECWIPKLEISRVRRSLIRAARRVAHGELQGIFPPLLTKKMNRFRKVAPTYFRLTAFTRGFQTLIDAYGMATYRELNPAPYTIITFPFLFAVMFGDVGHGIIMTIFALWMVRNQDELSIKLKKSKTPNEIATILFGGRYVILLMGFFSIYTGLIYNDIFSKAFNFFGSHWSLGELTENEVQRRHHIQLNPEDKNHYKGHPYIFGLDPIWKAAGEHSITTLNSYKMKLSIVLGFAQMLFGLALASVNFRYFKNKIDLGLVNVPQMTFLISIFGYLVFMIFFKWLRFGGHLKTPFNTACAPSILIGFINMILFKQSEEPPMGCNSNMFQGQNVLQIILMIIAFLSIPILLAGKPLHIMLQKRAVKRIKDEESKSRLRRSTLLMAHKSLVYHVDDDPETPTQPDTSSSMRRKKSKTKVKPRKSRRSIEEEEVSMSEIWIHQGIHCIESVLGSVSHTASYLRLWALSLAHDQLSTVLWNMVLRIGLTGKSGYLNSVVLYGVFWFWAILTVAILVVMEGLSAFLHTLRLHWVEFQSKFYEGAGQPFSPFRFESSRPHE